MQEDSDEDDNDPRVSSHYTAAVATARRRHNNAVNPSATGTPGVDSNHHHLSNRHSWTWSGLVCTGFSTLFLALLLVFAVAHLWIGHLLSEEMARARPVEQRVNDGLRIRGPTGVRFLDPRNHDNMEGHTPETFRIAVDGLEIGVDARSFLGWQSKDELAESSKYRWYNLNRWRKRAEAKMARWTVRQIKTAKVSVGEIVMFEHAGDETPLVVVPFNHEDMIVPLSYPSRRGDQVEMATLPLEIPIALPRPEDLAAAAQRAWDRQTYVAHVRVVDPTIDIRGQTRGLAKLLTKPFSHLGFDKIEQKFSGKSGSDRDLWGEVALADTGPVRTVPEVPGASDPASLVKLLELDVAEAHPPDNHSVTVIGLSALAQVKNPLLPLFKRGQLPRIGYGLPFRLPVEILLPAGSATRSRASRVPAAYSLNGEREQADHSAQEDVVLARVATDPFQFGADDHSTELTLSGQLVPISTTSKSDLSALLSRFFARYLAGKSNKVLVRYDTSTSAIESYAAPDAPMPPPALGDMLRQFGTVPLELPGAQGHLELFKNLKIEDMKIKLAGMVQRSPAALMGLLRDGNGGDEGDLLCSGRVVGEVNLPEMLEGLIGAINVDSIWPDVYVYDGGLPASSRLGRRDQWALIASDDEVDDSISITSYPPVPTPATAFARLSPLGSIPAMTIHVPANRTHNATTLISATFIDAPLYLLPGRGDVFRRFVGKIIFGGGPGNKVKAGARGVTKVNVQVDGWGQVQVEDMPVEGEFWVGAGGVQQG